MWQTKIETRIETTEDEPAPSHAYKGHDLTTYYLRDGNVIQVRHLVTAAQGVDANCGYKSA